MDDGDDETEQLYRIGMLYVNPVQVYTHLHMIVPHIR
jgi:hypothetical protein